MGVQRRVARATVYPVLALRGLVVFPQVTFHFDVAREKSVKALEAAAGGDQCIFLVAQKNIDDMDPTPDGLHDVGVVVRIRQVLKMPGDTFRVKVEGLYRARIREMLQEEPFLQAEVRECLQRPVVEPLLEKAYIRQCRTYFDRYVQLAEAPLDNIDEIAGECRL
ncbi:MAG: LON peptidase substrate-binding domain-containing protein, partial [Clostridia bacterium]|nr:LON peptidase substrate-binding domain-containing protein [Clostridia bacterium]